MIKPENLLEWQRDCLHWLGEVLENTPKAHWCNDWDDLPVNETRPEFECCTCYKEVEDGSSDS